jgi:uncharacterized repeat protein (TIGR03803 family)
MPVGGPQKWGTIFKITSGGTLTIVHVFRKTDGSAPAAGLIQASDGNFYGTTQAGGADGYGTVYKMTPQGVLTTLYSQPYDAPPFSGAALLQGTDGNFYGTIPYGPGYGSVFTLSAGLGPFVVTLPTSGKIGSAVRILGTDLTDATSVSFNGAPAAFTVVSPSEIAATVPTGATTGKVQVTVSSGLLTSNVAFRVRL